MQEIRLEPLARDDLGQLIADALHCESERSAPLAQLVQEKTAGNPFFVIQFLHTLAEEGLLAFDHDAARWRWDLERIHAKSYTDNVVDLMAGKLSRLPVETQQALQQMACLGNTAEIDHAFDRSPDHRRSRFMRRYGRRSVRNWSNAWTAPTNLCTTGFRRPPIR